MNVLFALARQAHHQVELEVFYSASRRISTRSRICSFVTPLVDRPAQPVTPGLRGDRHGALAALGERPHELVAHVLEANRGDADAETGVSQFRNERDDLAVRAHRSRDEPDPVGVAPRLAGESRQPRDLERPLGEVVVSRPAEAAQRGQPRDTSTRNLPAISVCSVSRKVAGGGKRASLPMARPDRRGALHHGARRSGRRRRTPPRAPLERKNPTLRRSRPAAPGASPGEGARASPGAAPRPRPPRTRRRTERAARG